MKNTLTKLFLGLVGIFTFTHFSIAQEEKYAPIQNGFGVEEKTEVSAKNVNTLTIINKHGNVIVNGWDKEIIEVTTLISVETTSYQTAEEILNFISIRSAETGRNVIFRTSINQEFFSNHPFKIAYTVNAPKRLQLDITNDLGDVFLNGINGNIKLDLNYGNLRLANSHNKEPHQMDINFSEARLDSCGTITGSLSNCTLTANSVEKIDFKSEYSTITTNQTNSVNLQSITDRIFITIIDTAQIKGDHLLVECHNLNKFGFFEIEKGQLTIDTTDELSQLTVSNDMANTNITLPKEYSYIINGEVTSGQFEHPNIDHLQVIKELNKISFSGKINTNLIGQLILFNENSDLQLKTR